MRRVLAGVALLMASACGADAPADNRAAGSGPDVKVAEGSTNLVGEQEGSVSKIDLSAYVGKWPPEPVNGVKFLDHPDVRPAIKKVVPDPAIQQWIFGNKGPQTPIAARGSLIISHGCEAHNCSDRNWAVIIDQNDGSAQVCYFELQEMGEQSRWYTSQGSEMRNEECPSK